MAHPVYRLANGKRVPSVTTVISAVLAKPALVKWANRMGLDGVETDTYRDELADTGTQVHEWIRQHLLGVEPDNPELDDEHLGMAVTAFSRWLEWLEVNPLEPVFGERPFVSERWGIGGTPDLAARHPRGLVLCDWKTSKSIYDEHLHQVSTYAELLEENGVHVERAVVVQVGRTEGEGFSERWLEWEEMRQRAELFRWALAIYRRQQDLNRGGGRAIYSS